MSKLNFIPIKSANDKVCNAVCLLEKYAKNAPSRQIASVSFEEDTSLFGDAYRIEAEDGRICVFGNTAVSFNAAVGYLVRHQSTGIETKTITFDSDFRAVYFANHFYNYYHTAPVEELYDYLESLALWGQNALCLWFDMHHFKSIYSPEAKTMIEKMVLLLKKAKSLGMKTSLTNLANEYYEGVEESLLAQNSKEGGRYHRLLRGYYYTELCPSVSEGQRLLLSSFEELLASFTSVGIDFIMLWPYDQGGCTCEKCYPWGSNGFYKIAKKKAELAKKYFPTVEIILSCWRFDIFTDGEWDAVLRLIKEDGNWIDCLMVDIGDKLPKDLASVEKPIVSFPEISMYGATPWGGFGANPFPRALAEQFRKTNSFCHGGALYSEGVFEDINKAVVLELMRDPGVSPLQVVKEYCTYHFGDEYAQKFADIIMRLENTLFRKTLLVNGERCDYPTGKVEGLHTYVIDNTDDIDSICRDFSEIDKKIPPEMKKCHRYQSIYARVYGDAALLKNGGVPDEETDKIYAPLVPLYHAENAFYFVSPITRKAILENRGNGA